MLKSRDSQNRMPTLFRRNQRTRHWRPSLESLENRELLTAAPEIIIADDAPALTAATKAPGFPP